MPKVVRETAAKREQLPTRPYLARSKKFTTTHPEEQVLEATGARLLTATGRSMLRSDLDAPLTKFELFPYLSIELRLEIWDLARPSSRRIDVVFKYDGRSKDHVFRGDVPILLHVCKESRHEMKKKYKCAFKHPNAINTCYFDFTCDTLFVSTYTTRGQLYDFFLRSKSREDFGMLRRLAVDHRLFFSMMLDGPSNKVEPFLFSFQGLKELILTDTEVPSTAGHRTEFHGVDSFKDMYDPTFRSMDGEMISLAAVLALCEQYDLPLHKEEVDAWLEMYKGATVNLFTQWQFPLFTRKIASMRVGGYLSPSAQAYSRRG